jgi:hypothetical protein
MKTGRGWSPLSVRRALAFVAVLALVTSLGGVLPALVPVRSAMAQRAEPETEASAPATRVLIAVPDAGTAPDALGLVALAARLHLADPVATVSVLPRGAADRAVGPFRIGWEAAAGPAAAATLRVESATGARFSFDLTTITPTGRDADGHMTVVEVLGGPEGITAWRAGLLAPSPVELRLPEWGLPRPGVDAVMLEGAWWSLVQDAAAAAASVADGRPLPATLRARLARTPVSGLERLVDASLGDVTGDGVPDLALSFRRPFQRTLLNVSRPRRAWVDADGLSAHVGLFRPDDLTSIWVAGTLLRPVHRLAACSGALAVSYSTLRRSTVVAATAWAWQGFGFLPLHELPGTGRPTCIDVDRDGRPEAAIIERG